MIEVSVLPATKKMLSTEIAALTDKEHKHVMRDIRVIVEQLGDSPDLGSGFTASEYKAGNGKNEPCYELDHEASMIVVTGYDVVSRAKVIKRWLELEAQQQPLSHLEILVQSAMALVEHERKMKALEEKVNHHYSQLDAKIEEVKAKTSASPDEYYSISGYAGLRGVNVDVHRAGRLGKVATRFSNENGYFIGKAHSELFGTVNSYHLDVLTDIFKKEK